MARVKIQLADNIKRVVVVDTDATRGAKLGTDLFMASGQVATPALVRDWLGLGSGGADIRNGYGIAISGTSPKTISVNRAANFDWQGQHSWEKPLWAPHGTAALPALSWSDDQDTGIYRVGADNVGISTDSVLRWDVNSTRTFQSVPLITQTADGRAAFFSNDAATAGSGGGLEVTTTGNVPNGADVELSFWEGVSTQNRFSWFLNGAPPNEAYYSLLRYDGSATANEVLRFSRSAAGGDWLEPCRISDGTIATPGLAFTSAPSLGIIKNGTFGFAFVATSTAGLLHIGPTVIGGNSNSIPAYRLSSTAGANLAYFKLSSNTGGAVGLVTTSLPLRFSTASNTITSLNQWEINTSGHFRSADNIELQLGTGGDLRLFHNGTNSTIRNGTGNLSVLSGSTEVLRFIQGASSRVHALNGTAALPAFGWFGDPDNGLYYITTNSFGIATAGALRYQFGAAGQLGIGGANYGTADTQAIVSGGASAAPSWQTVLVDGQVQTMGGDKTWTGDHNFSAAVSMTLSDYADDTAAAAGGVAVGQIYRNGSVVQIRVT